jgi:5-(aminomethyl)-3-furanmethanol phosphate kinase
VNPEEKRPLVVKLGGSLWRSPNLSGWISALRGASAAITLIPGGGPFADAVREAQGAMGYSDAAAHRMAMLGMEQYGLALVDLFDGLSLAATPDEANDVHARGAIAVWRPTEMVCASDVAASWDVTSDSLAAWYARKSGADRLLLIKSVDPETAQKTQTLVDASFEVYSRELEVFVAGPKALSSASQIFAQGGVAGARLDFALTPRKTRP